MSLYQHQAMIGDHPGFQLRVRQAIIKLAITVKTTEGAPVSNRRLATAVLDNPDGWSVQIARGLATIVPDTTVGADAITDEQIDLFLVDVFGAYLEVDQ